MRRGPRRRGICTRRRPGNRFGPRRPKRSGKRRRSRPFARRPPSKWWSSSAAPMQPTALARSPPSAGSADCGSSSKQPITPRRSGPSTPWSPLQATSESPPPDVADKYLYSERFHSRPERRDLAMAAKKAKGDDWFSSLDAELEKKTREIIENVGEQNVARLELNKTLIEDFWRVWKRFNKINVHFALEPSYTNWGVFPDTFPDGDWHWRPGFNTAAVQSIQLLDRSMDQGRVGDALKVNYVETDGKAHLRVTFEYCEGEHYYKYSGWKRIWTIHTLYDEPLDKTNVDDLHRLFADLVRVWYKSHLRRNRDVLIKYLKQTFEKVETFNQ